ncbi:MAG: ATPase, partial [Candidatus Cloacimonetes bacterium]|nr:ATPase [Candidatus Cloacimonadota bacterium]
DGIGNDDIYEYLQQEDIVLLARIPHQRRIAELYSQGRLLYKEVEEIRTALQNILGYAKELR